MLLEVLLICSLTHATPFYDCAQQWTIEIHSEPVSCFVGHQIMAAGCTNFDTKAIRIYDFAMYHYGKDRYGFTVLEHELEHLKCMCDFH
jgi:hypothetical protein